MHVSSIVVRRLTPSLAITTAKHPSSSVVQYSDELNMDFERESLQYISDRFQFGSPESRTYL